MDATLLEDRNNSNFDAMTPETSLKTAQLFT